MLEWSALKARENRFVDGLGVGLSRQDEAPTRTTERLVCRGRDDVGVWDWRRMDARGNEAGDVRHINHEIGADFFRDLGERRKIERAAVGARTRDDHAWM